MGFVQVVNHRKIENHISPHSLYALVPNEFGCFIAFVFPNEVFLGLFKVGDVTFHLIFDPARKGAG